MQNNEATTQVLDLTENQTDQTKTNLWLKIPYHTIRLILAFLFFLAAVFKIVTFNQFLQNIADYGIVYEETLQPVAIFLIVAELAGSILLAFNFRFGLLLITILLFLFIGVLTYGLWLGLDIECGCFGLEEKYLGSDLWSALWRDFILLGGILFLFAVRFLERKKS